MSRRSEFVRDTLRLPDRDEVIELDRLEREDRRREASDRREADLKRAWLGAGGTDADWPKERDRILADDRRQRAVEGADAASVSHSRLYRNW